MNRRVFFWVIIASGLLFAVKAQAVTRTVTSLGDSGTGTLRDTIAACASGDTIDFSVTGQIKLTSGTLTITKSVRIAGPGAALLEVTRASGVFRIFTILKGGGGGSPIVTISGIAITNGHSVDDGGVPNGWGGGIYSEAFPLDISNCIVSGNTADSYGGGIFAFLGQLIVDNTTFSGNSTTQSFANTGGGGAIFGSHSKVSLESCTFTGNSTTATKAGLNGGGAILNSASLLVITNCTFSGNHATAGLGGLGGAIYNTTIGGGTADTTIHNCTFSENAAPSGGGIANEGANGGNSFVTLDNTILFSSSNTPGANLFNTGDGTAITSNGFNLSSDDGAGFLNNTGDQKNTDPKLGPLQDNGGPTQTMALLSGSPAQDKGKSFNVSTDQRGLVRPKDIPGIPNAAGDGSDIGAVEMDFTPPFIVTTTADHDDGNCNASDCTLREAINAANAAGGADTILFGNGVTGVITLQLALGTLTVTDSVSIIGPGADILTVSGNGSLRPFRFANGASTMAGLAIIQGNPPNTAGNTIGGGLINQATLTINGCLFQLNTVHAASGLSAGSNGLDGLGGAIHNSGSLILNGCTFSQNQAIGGDGAANTGTGHFGGNGGLGQGGAIYNDSAGSLSINNCTFSGNSASGGAGGANPNFGGGNGAIGSGGGIANVGTMTVTSTTLSGNHALGGNAGTGNSNPNNGQPGASHGGGLSAISGSSTIRNTIVAGNTGNHGVGPDTDGVFNSGGYNLIGIGDGSSGFSATADQVGSAGSPLDAHLSPLQDNGGMTNTFALLTGSPAIDKGNSFGIAVDQRGLARPVDLSNAGEPPPGDGTDIGAFEMQATSPTTLANVSTRLRVETGDNVLFGGFIVTGTQPKKVIVRALGPSVQAPGPLANPTLELYQGNTLLETNDNWVDSPNKQAIIDSTIPPPDNLESAIVRSLPANATTYTAIVRGVNNGTGIGVIEVYDLDASVDSKLANISTRGLVQTGDNVLIAGTIVVGQAAQKVLICALGPSLPVQGNLANPTLELRDGHGTLMAANDNWVDSPDKQAIIDTGAAPTNNLESAIIHTLPAYGTIYTAVVRGANNGTGVAVVEVFALN